MILRPWQEHAVERLREAIRAGAKNVLVCAPTGSGKTIFACHVIQSALKRSKRAAFVADRLSLIDQTSRVFYEQGIDHGIIQADHPMYHPWKAAQICSQQTLARRQWPEADLIVVDEAHTVTKTVQERISKRDCITLGLTATPFTRGLGKLYDALVNVTTTQDLIDDGTLAKYRIFAATEPDMTGVKVIAGEWDDTETSKRALKVVGDVVAEYQKHGEGKKFICSAVDVAHVEELHRQFMGAGIQCATYTYRDSDDARKAIVTEFRKPDSYIRGLITVTAASKGFDVPDIGVVIMARPLRKSLTEHIQFFGRGLRSHPDKDFCLVLDHSGNSARFWNEWTSFFETGATELDDGKKKEKPKKEEDAEDRMVKCSQCAHLHPPAPFCPSCGHEHPKRVSKIMHEAGTLKELVAGGNRQALTSEVWPQVVGYALNKRDDAEGARKMALAIFKGITGVWPVQEFGSTPPAPITKEVAGKIRQMNIAYAARRKSEARA